MNDYLKYSVFAFLLIVAGCSKNTPKSVAEHFFKAMSKNDFDSAKKYGTDNTIKILDMLKGFQNMFTASAKREHKYEILSEKIKGDTATITYRIDNHKSEETVILIKQEGTWKVAMNIDNMADGSEDLPDAGEAATDEDTTINDKQ